jgi:hypothetical protein
MKPIMRRLTGNENFQLVAQFGEAQLVSTPEGRTELRGGTTADQSEAREWISLFMHEAAPCLVPGRGQAFRRVSMNASLAGHR